MQIQQRTMTRVGTTPTIAVHTASRELSRPIHRSIRRNSATQIVSQKCLQPPHPAPCHSAPQNQISPQLVLSIMISESIATDSCDHRSPAEPRQWVTHCEKLREMTRHLLIALQPRRVGPSHLVGMESDHLDRLRLDSTISPRRRRRYPLHVSTVRSTQSLAPPHHPNQKRRGEEIFTIDH